MVSLLNELSANAGQELLDIADQSTVVAIKSHKVEDFQGRLSNKILRLKVIGSSLYS